MGLFSHKDGDDTVVVLVDICSASVAIGCMLYAEGHAPRIIYTKRIPMNMELDITFEYFFRAMTSALNTALTTFVKEAPAVLEQYELGMKHIDNVIVTIGSPWYTASLRTVERTSEQAFEVTSEYVDTILYEDMAEFSKTLDTKKQVTGTDHVTIVDQSVLELKINGYPTAQREAESAHSISASVFASVISETVYERIIDEIEKTVGVKDITMHALPLALFAVVRDIAAIGDDFVVVDVGGEVTDCLFVREGVPELMYSVPVGHNTLVRKVAESLGLDAAHALSQLAIYAEGKSDPAQGTYIQANITETLGKLNEALVGVVEQYASDYTPPQYAFLTAGRGPINWVRQATGMQGLTHLMVGDRTFDTVVLGEQFLSPFSRISPESTFDTSLVIQALFAHTVLDAQNL